jgi:NADH-quinone oxidoreductase subunit C
MDVALRDLGEYVQASVVSDVLSVSVEGDELCIVVRRESIARVLTFLRDDINCQFKQLMDVCGVDYPGRPERFEVVYNLLSLTHNRRIRVRYTLMPRRRCRL